MADWIKADLRGGTGSANMLFNEKIKKLRAEGETIHHLGFGQCPFPVPEGAVKELQNNAARSTYTPIQGILPLREAIVDFHKKLDDLDHFTADDVIVAPGSKELIYLIKNALETSVVLPTPAWPTYLPQTKLARKAVIRIDRNFETGWKLTAEMLESALKTNPVPPKSLLVFTNPDNPTGCVYSEAELKSLAAVCRKKDLIVLSDEIYARCFANGGSNLSIAKFYPEGTLVCSGIAKWCGGGGWRVGYVMFPKELRPLYDAVIREGGQTYATVAEPIQWASVKLYKFEEEMQNYNKHFQRILGAVADYAHKELQKVGVKCHPASAAFYLFPDFENCRAKLLEKGCKTGQQMCDLLFEEEKVALMPGGPSFLRPEEELTTRLCYIDFNGGEAMKASEKVGLENVLPEDFVEKEVTTMYDAIQKLCAFVKRNS